MPQGHLPRRGGKRVGVSRRSPHLDDVHAHHDRRTRTPDRAPPPAGGCPDVVRRAGDQYPPSGLARAYPARRHVRRCRHELLAVLRGRRAGGTVPDRQGRQRRADQPRRGRRLRLALLPTHRHPGPALRLPGARAMGSRRRAPLRSEQAAAGPLRQVVPRRLRLQPGAVLLRPGGRRPRVRRHARRWSTRWATP